MKSYKLNSLEVDRERYFAKSQNSFSYNRNKDSKEKPNEKPYFNKDNQSNQVKVTQPNYQGKKGILFLTEVEVDPIILTISRDHSNNKTRINKILRTKIRLGIRIRGIIK